MKNPVLVLIALSVMAAVSCSNPFNSPQVKQQFVQLSKMQIKQLVMAIEFYKLQFGHYPDSLAQLTKTNDFIFIHDASSGLKTRQGGLYNYERIGEKYTLFSSGMDGIAGTKDDFYPEVEIPDSNRIGLIRKK